MAGPGWTTYPDCAFQAPSASTRLHSWPPTGDTRPCWSPAFVDLDRHRLIDVVPGRSAIAVSTWLGAKSERWLANIATAVIDPYSGYARGLAEGLGHARLVVDHFHAVRLANQALDEVRRRTQQTTLGHRGRRGDPLYRIRRRLLARP